MVFGFWEKFEENGSFGFWEWFKAEWSDVNQILVRTVVTSEPLERVRNAFRGLLIIIRCHYGALYFAAIEALDFDALGASNID